MSKPGPMLGSIWGQRRERRNQRRGEGWERKKEGVGETRWAEKGKREPAVCDCKGQGSASPLRAGVIVTSVYLGNFPKHRDTLRVWLSGLRQPIVWGAAWKFHKRAEYSRDWQFDQGIKGFEQWGSFSENLPNCEDFSSLLGQLRHGKIVIRGTYKHLSSVFTMFHECQSSPNPWKQSRRPGWLSLNHG